MKKGITIITLVVTITVMLILATTVTITSSNAINNSKKIKFASELVFMQETVDNYIASHEGSLPIIDTEIKNGQLPSNEYYEIDMSLLGLIETTYGRKLNNDITDIYVLSKNDGKVYYLKGLKIKNKVYYNLDNELKKIIDYTDTRILSRDGIIFTVSETNYTNTEINVKVQIPIEYSEVSVLSQNMQIIEYSMEEKYIVYNISKLGNFDIVVNYNKGDGILKQVYTVSNFDNESPTIEIKDITAIKDNDNANTSITISVNDNLSGVSKVLYEVDDVEKSYFEIGKKGKIINNNNVVVNRFTKYVTFYVVDKAGNSTILVKELNPNVTENDYVKYGLVLHYDAINNTGNGHSDNVTVWKDLSGNENNGLLINFDNTEVNSWKSNYLSFDGKNNYVLLNNILKDASNFTIEYIMTQKRYYSWEYFFGIKSAQFGIEASENFDRRFYCSSNSGKYITLTPIMGNLNEPVHNTIVYSNKIIGAYKNGELLVNEKLVDADIDVQGNNFAIGADSDGRYKSEVDYYTFRVYNRALTEDEIKQNYNIDKIRFGI